MQGKCSLTRACNEVLSGVKRRLSSDHEQDFAIVYTPALVGVRDVTIDVLLCLLSFPFRCPDNAAGFSGDHTDEDGRPCLLVLCF